MLVEDEAELLLMFKEWLEDEGHDVCPVLGGWEALNAFAEHRPVLTITDLRMPGMDGFQLISRIREISDTHILALTALGSEEHLIRGLELGADEYVVKPVSRRKFLVHVNSLLRRALPPGDLIPVYSDCCLTVDPLTRKASFRGIDLSLRPTEFRLLGFLAQNSNRVLTHQELLDAVWGESSGSLDSLKWYVSSLRDKLGDDAKDPSIIVTYPRVGYRYTPPNGKPHSHSPNGLPGI